MRVRVALLVVVVLSDCAAPVDTGPLGDDYVSNPASKPSSNRNVPSRWTTCANLFRRSRSARLPKTFMETYISKPSSNRNVPSRWTTSPSTSMREASETSVIMSTWTAESLPDSPSGRFAS